MEKPLLASKEVRRLLQYFSRFAQILGGLLVHSSLQILSKSLRFRGCRLATRSFSSLHRYSMGFRSGDWLGHSRTLICFFLSHSFVALAVCFGSLSCWKIHPRPIFSALTEGRRLSPKIFRYMAPFILPSIRWSHPVPLAEKHPQSIRFPPPCFTVGMVFLGLYSAFLFLQTWRVELMPNSSILVSSDHTTFSQASSRSSRCSLANFRWDCTCAFFSRETLRAQQDFNPSRCSVLLPSGH